MERNPTRRRKVIGIVLLVLLAFGFYCVHLLSQTRQIAMDLVNRTDSPSLHGIGSELQATLTELRSAPARVESCRLGDGLEWDPSVCSTIYLRNSRGHEIGILLRRSYLLFGPYHVKGFWTLQRPITPVHRFPK